jgi:molybdate/tungstate transport system ATP-binding protein
MIHITNLTNDWEGLFSLKDITFQVNKGEYFVILGPTGAGKTLLLEIIAGIHLAQEGHVFLDGEDVTHEPPEKRNIGFLYQDYSLFPHFTVEKNIEYGLKVRGVSPEKRKEKIEALMEMLNIGMLRERDPTTLSGGEQQKVAMARALAIDPKILLLDEPFSALDENTQTRLITEMKEIHRREGITVIHVTHDQEEAMILADRIAILIEGRIVQIGTPHEIFYQPLNTEIAQFVKIENIWEGTVISKKRDEITVAVNGAHITAIASGFAVGNAVRVIVRPEEIVIGTGKTSARNVLQGTITSLTRRGFLYRVVIDCGICVVASVTTHSVESLHLKEGKEITLFFKATATQIIPR